MIYELYYIIGKLHSRKGVNLYVFSLCVDINDRVPW